MVYLAEHPALAALEIRVHLDLPFELLPEDFVLLTVDLPAEPPETVTSMPADPRDAGDAWLRLAQSAVLRVPSILVPEAANLLLNPLHPRASEARALRIVSFRFDPRLWHSFGEPVSPSRLREGGRQG